MSEIKNRIDFVYIFDVQDGNPNGDPDAGNLPRVDAETVWGLLQMFALNVRYVIMYKWQKVWKMATIYSLRRRLF